MNTKKCPICGKEYYSRAGEGCKLCGMPLEKKNNKFCSKICREKFFEINGKKS